MRSQFFVLPFSFVVLFALSFEQILAEDAIATTTEESTNRKDAFEPATHQ